MHTCEHKLKCALREQTCCIGSLGSLFKGGIGSDHLAEILNVKCIMDKNEPNLPNFGNHPDTYIEKIFHFTLSFIGAVIRYDEGVAIDIPLDEIDEFLKDYCPFLHKDCDSYLSRITDMMKYGHKKLKWDYENKMRECSPMIYTKKQDEKYFI